MKRTLKEIADFIGGELLGDGNVAIMGVASIQDAEKGDLTFLANPKYAPYLQRTQASGIITAKDTEKSDKPIIRTENPSLAFVKAVSFIAPSEIIHPKGIHPSAVLGQGVKLGQGIAIGPYAVIEDNASIGDKSVIYAGVYIGGQSKIGKNSLIYPHVSIREGVVIGNNVIIHSGTVIGSDGFGFVTVEGKHHKIPQVGIVVVEDNVEIGANVTIDRARFDKTIIGEGTKIDNLVHLAHNVIIGKNCLVIAQVGISGSVTIGSNVILAGQVGVVGHVNIGDNCIVMAQSGVSKSIPAGTMVWGYPAKPEKTAKRLNASVANLPRLYENVDQLKKKIEELEKRLDKKS